MSDIQLRTRLEGALKSTATGDLRASALELLSTLGYASNKTLDWPTQPQAFSREVEALLGGIQHLNAEAACLADWSSVSFLFQLTNDELPTLAAGQMSFFSNTGVQPYQIESFIFLAVDLKPGNWSRTRLARITRELNRLFPMPVIVLYRHPGHDQEARRVRLRCRVHDPWQAPPRRVWSRYRAPAWKMSCAGRGASVFHPAPELRGTPFRWIRARCVCRLAGRGIHSLCMDAGMRAVDWSTAQQRVEKEIA